MEYEPSGLDFVVTGGTGSVEERTILTSESAAFVSWANILPEIVKTPDESALKKFLAKKMPDDKNRTKNNTKVTALRFGMLLKKLTTYPSKRIECLCIYSTTEYCFEASTNNCNNEFSYKKSRRYLNSRCYSYEIFYIALYFN